MSAPAFARADTIRSAPDPTPEQVDAARALYHEARELHRQGKLREALGRALEAYGTASTPVTGLEAAALLVEVGELVEARDLARAVPLLPATAHESDKGRDARREAAALAGTLDGRIPKIAVAGRPAGLDVRLDDKPFAGADASAWLGVDPGAHALVVRSGDRVCTRVEVTLGEGEARTIDLHDAARPCGVETVAVPALPPPAAAPPVVAVEPASGSPAARASTLRIAGLAAGAAGLVTIVAGGAVALGARSRYDSVAGGCSPSGCTSAAFDVRQSARTQGDVATALLVVGGGGLAAGVTLLVLAPFAPAAPQVAFGAGSVRLTLPFE